MNDIQAVLGLNQLKRLDQYVSRRHEIAQHYNNELKNFSLTLPWQDINVYSSYHLYPILIKNKHDFKSQIQVYNELRENNIAVNLHYTPVHRHPYYENLGFKKNDFPISEKFHQEAISIPMYAILKKEHQEYVIETLKKIMIS
jgi:dTDP-4-amino-4,6-dideoxygalactose transaminase